MIFAKEVDLAARGIQLPQDRVGLVVAQPYVPTDALTQAEPYQWTLERKGSQLDVISRTLAIARAANHNAGKTHFTILPEYSVPGPEGIALIDESLRDPTWAHATVVIGGTDGLSRQQYCDLLAQERTYVDARNAGDVCPLDQWVNCVIIWVKSADGQVERWVQPKLSPAWEELNASHQHMFCGRSIFVFRGVFDNGAPFRFSALVCFDWIASVASKRPFQWIFADLEQRANGNQVPFSWMFVVQRNKRPSHDTFLGAVAQFFNQTEYPNALRERACIVFANTAGRAVPGRATQFGSCSLVFSPQSLFHKADCAPTYASGGPRFRDGSTLLNPYKDAVLRERGACIHSFAQTNPAALVAGAAGRSFPISHAHVYSIEGAPEPRAPNGPVAAAIKWLNDELDGVSGPCQTRPEHPLAASVTVVHGSNVGALRVVAPQRATLAVKVAAQNSEASNADDWGPIEAEALAHLVNTLDIVGLAFASQRIEGAAVHAELIVNEIPIDILAVRGVSHELCVEHSARFVSNPRRHTLLVSRDEDNVRWHKRLGNFLVQNTILPGRERKITDPQSGMLHIGYQNLLEIFLESVDVAGLGAGINAELAA